jgi:hypothetical protein
MRRSLINKTWMKSKLMLAPCALMMPNYTLSAHFVRAFAGEVK